MVLPSSSRNDSTVRSTGLFITSTGEAPGTNRLEIVGTRGTRVVENNKLTFARNSVKMLEFRRTATQWFVKPEAKIEEIPFANAEVPHVIVIQNFVKAILDGDPLIAPGPEGIHAVELANAMVFSSLLGHTLELPMDGSAWEKQLNGFITSSQVKKNVVQVATDDFASSFRK